MTYTTEFVTLNCSTEIKFTLRLKEQLNRLALAGWIAMTVINGVSEKGELGVVIVAYKS